ncbi:MAG: polysaccharide deacetylase family protein [Labilithrix sp.]|nr:polysaccharide deacetylase family protein [Labilithrix sp.]
MISRVIASSVFHAMRVVAPRLSAAKRRLPRGGFVSFTFDDFPSSAAREGASLVASFGARATFYASMSMTKPDDVARVIDGGHELGCHTYSHLDCFRADDAEIERDVARNAREMAPLLGEAPRHFAYPFGRLRPRHKRLLASRFATQRSIFPGAHRDVVDLSLVRANRLYASPLLLWRARRLVDDVARNGGWVVFFTHDVSDRPTRWGARERDIAAIAERALRAGLTIAPVGAIVERTLTS